MNRDEEHLKLLSIFHYVVGGIAGLFALFPIFHLIIGLVFVFSPSTFADKGSPPPAFFGWFFVIFAGTFILMGLTFAGCIIAAGRNLGKRRRYTFCLAMACVECIFLPFGTVLGVFTIIVLMRDSVRQSFNTTATA